MAVSHMSGVPFSSLCASLKCEMAHQKSEEKEEAGFNYSSRSKSPLQLPQRPAILLKPVQQTELPPRSVDVPRQGSELLLYLREASGGKLLQHRGGRGGHEGFAVRPSSFRLPLLTFLVSTPWRRQWIAICFCNCFLFGRCILLQNTWHRWLRVL